MLQKMVMIILALLLLAAGDIAKAARLARVNVVRGGARREQLQ